MRRTLSHLRFCFLCAMFAHGVGILRAVQIASTRPPDVGSASDDQTLGEQPPAFTATPPYLSTERVQNAANEVRSLQSGASIHENAADFNCDLTSETRDRYISPVDQTWLITDAVLKEVGSDLQRIVNCTKDGDVILFDVTGVIQPSSLVIIPWRLTLSTHVVGAHSNGGDSSSSRARTRFTCPRTNTGLFLVRAKSVTFTDLVFEGCTFEGTDEVRSVIEVSQCEDQKSAGIVALHRVTLRKNTLISASGIRMSASSGSELEMTDVEIEENVCSGDGCGVLLANKSSLHNCTVSRNKVVESDEQQPSLLYALASSNTTMKRFVAYENDLTVVRVQDAVISLSKASFNRNSAEKKNAEDMELSCNHSIESSAAMRRCTFFLNEGANGSSTNDKEWNAEFESTFPRKISVWNGSCLYAESSDVTFESATATDNSAGSFGGFMHASESNVTFKNFTATNNNAEFGGFMHASESNVTFKNFTATNNSAGSDGGFIDASESNVTFKNFTAANNNAGFGGFIKMEYSNVSLETFTAANNSAGSNGGFIQMWRSNVSLETFTAANNSVWLFGGFMLASESNVTFKNFTATNNSAGSDGGFIDASESNVTFKSFTAANNNAGFGGFIDARDSNVSLENFTATNNSAGSDGGFIKMEYSNVSLETFTATNNTAGSDGGFIDMWYSNVSLETFTATNNTAGSDGGFIDASESNVTFKNFTAANNNAGFGGFIDARDSNVSLENFTATNNSAGSNGGFIKMKYSYVTLENFTATNNSAGSNGGFMYARDSNVSLENFTATNNSAGFDGGFMFSEGSTVLFEYTNASNSSAENGGFMCAKKSKVQFEHTNAACNGAENFGGFMSVTHSTVTLDNTNATSNTASDGGFMFVKNSTAILNHTIAKRNTAQNGGFMFAKVSNAKLEHTNAVRSTAEKKGGFVYAERSIITLVDLKAANGGSSSGGLIYARNSTQRITRSQWSSSISTTSGGFAAATDGSSIFINDSTIVREKSKDGGAIWLKKSHLAAHNLSIAHCEADNGGGVMSVDSSTLLCAECVLHDNSANRGNGGGVYFDADPKQTLALQLIKGRVENNTARLGGGLFFVCEQENIDCPLMALAGTQLSGNVAGFGGGAVFVGYPEAIRIRCSNTSSDASSVFYEEKEWKTLHSVKSIDDVCPEWKGNSAKVYGADIATYAASARMTIEDANNSVCESGGEECVIEGYRAGTKLPTATVTLLDHLHQERATSYQPVAANMSSAMEGTLSGSLLLSMDEGNCTFQSIRSYVSPGEYKLTIEFGQTEIESIGLTLIVRNCSAGESMSDAGICLECSITTYNFPRLEKGCKPCPENGNCESKVITPNNGYWHQMPCSAHLHRCLPASACESEDRSEKLVDAVRNLTSCDLDETWIENYTQAQCAEGNGGPLCRSCLKGFGSGLSSECRKCLKGFFNTAYILMSALFLLGLTAITIHGTLSALRGDARRISSQGEPSSSSVGARDSPLLEQEGQADDGVPASEKVLAKWKAVEMFKITLSYTQVTVLLASLDVGWAFSLIVMAGAAEFLGGLASDGIRRSVVCLSSEHLFLHPTALALVVNTCIVPCAVLLFWIVFWAMKSKKSDDGLQRYLAKRCMLSLMVIWYITLVPVLKTALSVFLCVDVHDSMDLEEVDATHKYWVVDTALECYQGDHLKLIYAVIVAFVCPVYGGLLVLFGAFLGVSVNHLTDKQGWGYQTTGFLYRSYKLDRRRYWEVAIIARKAAIAFLVFCAHLFDSAVPITGVACFITLAIAAQILVLPYRHRFQDLNRIEVASLLVSLMTTLIASMLKDENYPENYTQELLTVACVLLNIITFSVFIFYILKFTVEYLKHSLREKGEDYAPDAGVFRILMQWIVCKINHYIAKLRATPEEPEIPEYSAVEAE